MTSSVLNRLAILAMTLAVAVPIAPREIVVLCLGADGHVAIEEISERCRDQVATSAGKGEASCSDGCGPCRDVQLITSAHAIGRPHDSSMLAPHSLVATPAWSMDPLRYVFARRHAFAPSQSRASGGISSRALVALLI